MSSMSAISRDGRAPAKSATMSTSSLTSILSTRSTTISRARSSILRICRGVKPGGHERALLVVLLAVLVDHAGVGRDVRPHALAIDEGLRVPLNRDDVVVPEDLPDVVVLIETDRLVLEEVVVHLVRVVVRRRGTKIEVLKLHGALVFHGILRISASRG